MAAIQYLSIDPTQTKQPTRDYPLTKRELPPVKKSNLHPIRSGGENARIYFVGTATTILEWEGIRLMTDPNFLHAGEHVHLGPGVTAKRETNPAVDLQDLPPIDIILLSHYHEDHFDRKVESSLRRDIPIITTPHAKHHLHDVKDAEEERFTAITALDTYETAIVDIIIHPTTSAPAAAEEEKKIQPALQITAMPGKHIPSGGVIDKLNDLLGAVPPTNGWMLELGYHHAHRHRHPFFECAYRIYISGDTLLVDELREIPQRYNKDNNKAIDLMLVHLGGTTLPSTSLPLIMVTMDAKQGLDLIRLVKPDLTLPVHFDDYDIFQSPLDDLRKLATAAAEDEDDDGGDGGVPLAQKIIYWDRGEEYKFRVRAPL